MNVDDDECGLKVDDDECGLKVVLLCCVLSLEKKRKLIWIFNITLRVL